ncbi:MAG TPA: hydrogenase small subunit [Slackia equolifaciens]|uniref:Hydrogenase small subunit n=1 Tax=Slackia equolifaciens TaxID=498718 RepID=A0A9D2UVV7_9ACTN|nr:hydrogenase small subunit [Slackia equolifaciens]
MDNKATATEFQGMLESRGVSRRSFMKLCGTIAVMAGLGEAAAPRVAHALEESVIGASQGDLYPVIWIEGASCTGCTEAFAQIDAPDAATVVLELISLNYSETLSAAAGHSMEEAKAQTIEAGNYILVYEGAVLKGWDGNALRVADKPGYEHLTEAAANATAVVALGSCAVNGGWMAAHPNPSNAMGVQQFLQEEGISTPVINIPGCPPNPEWLCAVLIEYLLLNRLPELNAENKPTQIFGQTIHDNCQRRGHFENGEFVYQFGSPEEAKGYCLYPLGCRGPQTKANCGIVRYNHRRSWCVEAGAPCIGCCEANPMNPGQNWVEVNTPFFKRHRDLRVGDFLIQPEIVAPIVTGVVAVALVIHGFGMKAAGRVPKGAEFEKVRAWDAKHPDKSIGVYKKEDVEAASKKGGDK